MKEELHDCSGCTDPRSEGTHQGHTKQHRCPEGGDPHCGYCTPTHQNEACICEEDNKLTQALCRIHGAPAYRHQNEAEWELYKQVLAIANEFAADGSIIPLRDAILSLLSIHISKAQIAEVVNPDELAERIVIDYANRSGRDDNRPEVRDAARAVLEAVREKLLGNEGK